MQQGARSLYRFESGLDNTLLNELYDSDYESALQGFEIYLEELNNNLLELEQAYKKGEVTLFKKAVHRLKPVFGYVGLSALNQTFQSLEDQCSTLTDLKQINPAFQVLAMDVANTRHIIEKEKVRLEAFINSR